MDETIGDLLEGRWPNQPPWIIREAASCICERIKRGSEHPDASQARRASYSLKSHVEFDSLLSIADAWLASRGFDPSIAALSVQAHIELNELDRAQGLAIDALHVIDIGSQTPDAIAQAGELEGLLARIHKQRFVLYGRKEDFEQALHRYLRQYQAPGADVCWHGVNLVALLRLGERQFHSQSGPAGCPDAASVATHVRRAALAMIEVGGRDKNEWAVASLVEACMSLGLCDEAELWLHRLLTLPTRTHFPLRSLQRQLRDVWGANAYAERPTCPDTLARIIVENQDRRFDQRSFSPAELITLQKDENMLERNFSGDGFFSVDSIQKMLVNCRSIGCVTNARGVRLGSGFLVAGEHLHAGFGPGLVFVTNAHVLSEEVSGALRISDARITFDLENEDSGSPVFYRIDSLLFSSTPSAHGLVSDPVSGLDVTIVRLSNTPANVVGLSMADDLPLLTESARAYVIGHPRGSEIQVSLHDSRLLDIDVTQRLVHYRTPTDPGSSGSPVFNALWKVIALHHAGSEHMRKFVPNPPPPFYQANEGISIMAIKSALASLSNLASIHGR